MYIVKQEVFEGLPEEVQQIISTEAISVDDEEKAQKIEGLLQEPEGDTLAGESFEEVSHGEDAKYKDAIDNEGNMKELSEGEKKGIGSLDEAGDRGMSLLMAIAAKPKKKQVGKIPTEEQEPDDKEEMLSRNEMRK